MSIKLLFKQNIVFSSLFLLGFYLFLSSSIAQEQKVCEPTKVWIEPLEDIFTPLYTDEDGGKFILFTIKYKVTKTEPECPPNSVVKAQFAIDISGKDNPKVKYLCYDSKKTKERTGMCCDIDFVQDIGNGDESRIQEDITINIPIGVGDKVSIPIPVDDVPKGKFDILFNFWKPGNVGNPEALKEGKCHEYKYTGQDACRDVKWENKNIPGTFDISKSECLPTGKAKRLIEVTQTRLGELEILFPTKKIPFAFTSIAGGGCSFGDWLKGAYPFWVVEKGTENIVSKVSITVKDSDNNNVDIRDRGDGWFVFTCDALNYVYNEKRGNTEYKFTVDASKEGYVSKPASIGFDWNLRYEASAVSTTAGTGTTTVEEKKAVRGTECPTDYTYRCNPDNEAQIQVCSNGKWSLAYTCPVTGTTGNICDETKTSGNNYGCKEPEKKQETVSTCVFGSTSNIDRTCDGVSVPAGYYWCKDKKAYMIKPTNCV